LISASCLLWLHVSHALRPSDDFEGSAMLAAGDKQVVRASSAAHEAVLQTDCQEVLEQMHRVMVSPVTAGAWSMMQSINVLAWYDLYREIDFISRLGKSKLLRRVAQQVNVIAGLVEQLARTIAGAAAERSGTTVDDTDPRDIDERATKSIIDTYFTPKVTLQVLHVGGAENRPATLGRLLAALKTFRRMLPPALKRLKKKPHRKCFSYFWGTKLEKYERFMTETITTKGTGVRKTIHHPLIGSGSTGTPVWYIQRIMTWLQRIDTEDWFNICDTCIRESLDTCKAQVEAANNFLAALFAWDEPAFVQEPTEFTEDD